MEESLLRLQNLNKKELIAALQHVCKGESAAAALAEHLAGQTKDDKADGEGTKGNGGKGGSGGKGGKKEKGFQLESYRLRQVALQVQYDGGAYLGFASQDCDDTVENHLFAALTKLKLIADRKSCRYSRCGRTDKGVSALGQVVSVCVRSAVPRDLPDALLLALPHPCAPITLPLPTPAPAPTPLPAIVAGEKEAKAGAPASAPAAREYREMDYVTMLNRCLPPDIRILAWAPVTDDFSARFSASHRTYRYFFPRAKLDILAMQQGACRLLGEHDFSNLCKMDMGNVSNFKREVFQADIRLFKRGGRYAEGVRGVVLMGVDADAAAQAGVDTEADDAPIDTEADADAEDVYMLELRGVAFLWHMVRCIMAVLFSIGQGREDPSVLDALFDIQGNPGKPAYAMAPEAPLVLHECGFDNLHLHQHPRNLWQLTAHYRDLLASHQVSAARARNALDWVMEQHLVLADATNADADADADADAGAGANTHTGPTHTASAPTTSTSTAPTTAPISAPTTAGAAGLLLLRELVDSVLQQQSRTQQRLISRGITVPTTLTNTATATTTAIATATAGVQMHGGSSSSSSGVGSVGSVGNVGQKRKLGAGGSPTTHTEAVPQTETAGGEGGAEVEAEAEAVGGTDAFMARLLLLACPQGEQGQGGEQGGVRSLRWGQVLHRLEAQCGEPQLKYVPYVPLLQRKREHSYQEKALHLQGTKRERLDRHIALSGATSAAGTGDFFARMRAQGSL